jgi:hypothetical protein
MSDSHQTSLLDLKGLVLSDQKDPSPQRLYPIFNGTGSHSPDYDWVTQFPKILHWGEGTSVNSIIYGTIKPPTRTEIESELVTDIHEHARTFLNKKLDSAIELFYQGYVTKAVTQLSLPYLDMKPRQNHVPEDIYIRLTSEEKQFFTVSDPDKITSDPDNYGEIDIYDLDNRWRRQVAFNWKKLHPTWLSYKPPADKNVRANQFEHLTIEEVMTNIRENGSLLEKLNKSMQTHNNNHGPLRQTV